MGKIVQKRIMDVKLKVPQRRKREGGEACFKEGKQASYIINNTSNISGSNSS